MKIICHTYQDRPMLSVCGPLTVGQAAALEQALDDIRGQSCDRFYLDLSGVGLLDEATCQLLTRMDGQLDGRPIELTFVTPYVQTQLQEIGLDRIYAITPERRRWTRGWLATWQRLAFLERRHELYDDHLEFPRRTLIWCGVGLACLSLVFVLLIGRLSGVLHGRTTTPSDSPSLETVVKQKRLH
jgi:ABC-type transporter Mla MlaB component